LEIKGKAAIATGASSDDGIGAECAKILASRGCNVVVNYATNKAGAEKVVAHCKAAGVDAIAVQGDVSKDEDCVRLVKTAIDRWGRPRCAHQQCGHHQADPAQAHGPARCRGIPAHLQRQSHRQLPDVPRRRAHLKATGDAAIVNISSVGAMRAGGSSMAYVASKGALNTLTLSMARLLAPEVRVNALCPGGMLGHWTRQILTEEQYQERVRRAKNEFPLGKGIWPVDVARAALFLVEGRDRHDRRMHSHGLRPASRRDQR